MDTPGASCPEGLSGDDAKVWNSLNSMNEHKIGAKVVSSLCDSKKKYSIVTGTNQENNFYKSNNGRGNCGGTINLVKNINNIEQAVPHELFHAYQDEKGQYGRSIHNEVEAFMFEAIVCNEEYGGHLNSRKELPISDPYVTANLWKSSRK